MEGAARAAKRKHEATLFAAFDAAAFNGAAFAGKLASMKKYLPKQQGPKRAQSASEMLAAMREFQTRGANMKITRVN